MVKIAGVELNRGVLVALMGSLALPALYSVIAELSMSLSVARFIRAFYTLGGPVVMAIVLYHCGLVMFLYSKQERNRDDVQSALRRMLYGVASLVGVGLGFVLTAGLST